MLAKRIIPCLDIKNGRTVKGTKFANLRDAGDPIVLAQHYAEAGADELVFLDITATLEKRKTLVPLVRQISAVLDIPFTVGGGIADLDLVDELLQNGADKVSINSAAVRNPALINQVAEKYGSQCVTIAIDAKNVDGSWKVHTGGGTHNVGLDLYEWAAEVVERGAGEILFTSMDADGTKAGFEVDALAKLTDLVRVPVIASGGAGKSDDFVELFTKTECTGGLAASIFHFKEVEINALKSILCDHDIPVRQVSISESK